MQGYTATTGACYIYFIQYAPYIARLSDAGIRFPDFDFDIIVTASDYFGLGTETPRSGSSGTGTEV